MSLSLRTIIDDDDSVSRLPDSTLYDINQIFGVLNSTEAEQARETDDDLLSGDVTGEQHPDQIGGYRTPSFMSM